MLIWRRPLSFLALATILGLAVYLSIVRAAAAPSDAISGLSSNATPTQNAAALAKVFSSTRGGVFEVPAGTFVLPCGSSFTAAGPVSLVGKGIGRSVLRLDRSCVMVRPLMQWVSKSGVHLSGFTIDLSHSRFNSVRTVLSFEAYNGNAAALHIDHIALVNGNSPSLQIGVGAAGGFTYSDVLIEHNQIAITPARTQNQCIALTTVNNSGRIHGARIIGNVCKGSAIQGDGEGTIIADNDVSNFQFGQGIFLAYTTRDLRALLGHVPSARDCVIRNNFIHDTPQTTDVNRTAPGGIENNCINSLVSDNRLRNLGGPGFLNFANGAKYVRNQVVDVGFERSGSADGDADGAAFVAFDNGSGINGYQSAGLTLEGNQVVVEGGRPRFGYFEEPYHQFTTRLVHNSLNGRERAQVVRSQRCQVGTC